MKLGCVLFDLDGTLLNTNDLVLESLHYTIKCHLATDVETCELYKYFGQPLVKIMADLDPDQADDMVQTYRKYSADRHDHLTRVFPKAPETLKELKSLQIPVAVVTSKLKEVAYRGLQLCNLDDCFDAFIAFEDTVKHKPEPDPIMKALEVMGVNANNRRVIMVGDSPYDIICARNAGVTSAAVEWSLHPREVLAACIPDIWLPDLPSLLNYI